jgi:hypothetical protein
MTDHQNPPAVVVQAGLASGACDPGPDQENED